MIAVDESSLFSLHEAHRSMPRRIVDMLARMNPNELVSYAELDFATGVLQTLDRPEYAAACREAHDGAAPPAPASQIAARFDSALVSHCQV